MSEKITTAPGNAILLLANRIQKGRPSFLVPGSSRSQLLIVLPRLSVSLPEATATPDLVSASISSPEISAAIAAASPCATMVDATISAAISPSGPSATITEI